MSGRHSTSTSSASRDVSCDANNNALLSGDNLLRLALKKPDSWNWELTTSSSSPNISFPKIQLFDGASGELMVEVAQPDCVIRSDCSASIPTSESPRMVRYGRSRTSLVKEKRPTSGDSLADIFSQLSSKGLGHKLSTSGSQYRLANGDSDPGRRVLQKSKSANAIAAQEAPVVRRKSRRSVASRSSSILERISEFYGRSSTDDDDSGDRQRPAAAEQEQKVEPGNGDEDGGVTIEEMPADPPGKARPKIYKLVRSNAGTLMVREESFHTQRSLRRRQREVLDGDSSQQQQQQQPQISEQYVELDKQLDRPAPVASRYEQEINHIDHLLSRVMLSHDLQTEEDAQRQGAPNIRISPAPDVATLALAPASHHLQNGRMRHTRRTRRSVSVGSSLTSSSRHRSISSGRSNSPVEQRIDRRRRSSSSSSEEACASRLFNDPSTGSSSRSNSLKRRGRTRRRGDPRDSSSGKSNADELIAIDRSAHTAAAKPKGGGLPSVIGVRQCVVSSTLTTATTGSSNQASLEAPPTSEQHRSAADIATVRTKLRDNYDSSATTVSFFLADNYSTSDKVLLKLVQSFRRSLHSRKRSGDRAETKRRGCSSWLRHVPSCCAGSGKAASPPAVDDWHDPSSPAGVEPNGGGSGRPAVPQIDHAPDDLCLNLQHLLEATEPSPIVRRAVPLAIDDYFTSNENNAPGERSGYERTHNYDLEHDVAARGCPIEPSEPTPLLRRAASERPDRAGHGIPGAKMGANVSSSARHHAKGLSGGRRAQSTDNLKSDTTQYFHQYHNNNNHGDSFHQQTFLAVDSGDHGGGSGEVGEKQSSPPPPPPDLACIDTSRVVLDRWNAPQQQQQQQQQLQTRPSEQHVIYVSQKDRNKFCGSLPNHLDLDDDSSIDRDCKAIIRQNEAGILQHQQQAHQHQLQLKLPLQRTTVDAGFDQGYGSERSPEDEMPPPLLLIHEAQYNEILMNSAVQRSPSVVGEPAGSTAGADSGVSEARACTQGVPMMHTQPLPSDASGETGPCGDTAHHLQLAGPYSFITKDCIFYVSVTKGTRGLGLSVSGGTDSAAPYPGLIRIKRIFPHQAAWATGLLQPGDILLEVNGCPLTGLTNFHALAVLRSAADVMTLAVARPKDDQYLQLSPPSDPPKPPLRATLSNELVARPTQDPVVPLSGEFEIVMTKQQGSLGFTLRDESVHGHYVRMLMREPALRDGRIRPGDQILEVNHVPISTMTHQEAVLFLRRAADVVLLRLYRDPALSLQSPADSSTAGTDTANPSRPASADRFAGGTGTARPKTSLRPEVRILLTGLAATRQQQQQQQNQLSASQPGCSVAHGNTSPSRRLRRAGLPSHQRHATSGQQACNYPESCSDASYTSQDDERYYSDWELESIAAEDGDDTADQRNGENRPPLSRPTFLDLDALGGGADVGQFAPEPTAGLQETAAEPSPGFTSLPCETFLVACKIDRDLQAGEDAYTDAIYVQHFARKSPLYSSVNVPATGGPSELVDAVQQGGKQSLLKWYGATMLAETDSDRQPRQERSQSVTPDQTGTSETASCSREVTRSTTPTTEIELSEQYADFGHGLDSAGGEIFTADLHKGWSSRLGFSLKPETDDAGRVRTVISAIYPDSVASRSGRLRVGDVLLSVNDDSVESLPTAQVIELVRIARGTIFLVLMRPAGVASGAIGKLKPTPEEPEREMLEMAGGSIECSEQEGEQQQQLPLPPNEANAEPAAENVRDGGTGQQM
uniref:PDZ domain-containing protein n=1 Tax=Anopheles atroparvus TaxID=41427 RepID=A0AAG5DWH6_ANOAO